MAAAKPSSALVDVAEATLGTWSPKPTATTPGQQERDLVVWTSPDGSVSAGVWDATVGSFLARKQGLHESCHIVSGEVLVVDDEGEHHLTAGSLFVMPDGWEGRWDVLEPVRKSYVVVRTG